jgi:hypothetical protein
MFCFQVNNLNLTWALSFYVLLVIINWWKKWINFVENYIPFEWKYLTTLHETWIGFLLNWNSISYEIAFNSIQILFNKIELNLIYMKLLKSCWKFACQRGVRKEENTKNAQFEKTPFHASLLGNKLNRLQFGTIQVTTYDL